jgi:integrase
MKGNNRQRYLTEAQLGQLIKAARKGRYGQRDSTLILIMARHGLRVTEAVDLRLGSGRCRQGTSARSTTQKWH